MLHCKQKGVRINERGTPIGYEGQSHEQTALLGGKQLAESFYDALFEDPFNPHLLAAFHSGYPVLKYPKSMPVDCKHFRNAHHNTSHDGCAATLGEKIEEAKTVQAGWHAHMAEKKQSSRSFATKGEFTYHKAYAK